MNAIVRINDENPCYSSLVPSSREEQKLFFNAKENPQYKVSDFINKTFAFSNIFMEKTEIMEKDENGNPTGVVTDAIKTVFITNDGVGIVSTSKGIANAVYGLIQVFGTPDTWEEPMVVEVQQVELKNGNRTFKLCVV